MSTLFSLGVSVSLPGHGLSWDEELPDTLCIDAPGMSGPTEMAVASGPRRAYLDSIKGAGGSMIVR